MSKVIENNLIKKFSEDAIFSREALFDFFKHYEPNLNESTFGWRIYNLKNKDIIKSIYRGFYTLSHKTKYNPEVSEKILELAKVISTAFEGVKYCLWESNWLNEFTQHQSNKNIIVIEIEKDYAESLYYELKDFFPFDFYINPDKKIIDFYVSESQNPIIIRKLITRSPISKRKETKNELYIPLLEKILVDVFSDDKLFYHYQGIEMTHLYENALKKYSLNYTKLFSYAKRRKQEQAIKQFMAENMHHLVKHIM